MRLTKEHMNTSCSEKRVCVRVFLILLSRVGTFLRDEVIWPGSHFFGEHLVWDLGLASILEFGFDLVFG